MSYRGIMSRMGINIDDYNVDIWNGKISARNLWSRFGDVFYLDTAITTGGTGRNWAKAFKTLAAAQAKMVAGDALLVKGAALNEQLTINKAGVTVWGVGPGVGRCLWTAPNDTYCIEIDTVDDCLIGGNIRFRPPAYTAYTPAAIYLHGLQKNTVIQGCRFQGKASSYYGILTDGLQSEVHILDNEFWYMNTATNGTAIKGTGYATAEPTGWIIEGNRFHSNLNHIVCRLRQSMIINNYFAGAGLDHNNVDQAILTVLGIDIHGATGGCNVVTRNYLGSLYYQACYYGGTNDDWGGNFVTDRSHGTQVDATTGLSILPPAA